MIFPVAASQGEVKGLTRVQSEGIVGEVLIHYNLPESVGGSEIMTLVY